MRFQGGEIAGVIQKGFRETWRQRGIVRKIKGDRKDGIHTAHRD